MEPSGVTSPLDGDDSDDVFSVERTPIHDFTGVEYRLAQYEREVRRLHRRVGEVRDRNALYDRQIGAHHASDEERFRRVDEHLAEAKEHRKSGAAKQWAIVAAVAGALGTAGVSLYTSAVEKGGAAATIRQLVERQHEHQRRLDTIERRFFRFIPLQPDDPAPTGD